eukprot:2545239-Amphidinium_carterae.1
MNPIVRGVDHERAMVVLRGRVAWRRTGPKTTGAVLNRSEKEKQILRGPLVDHKRFFGGIDHERAM